MGNFAEQRFHFALCKTCTAINSQFHGDSTLLYNIYPCLSDSIVKAISFSEFLLEKNYPPATDKSSRYKFAVSTNFGPKSVSMSESSADKFRTKIRLNTGFIEFVSSRNSAIINLISSV